MFLRNRGNYNEKNELITTAAAVNTSKPQKQNIKTSKMTCKTKTSNNLTEKRNSFQANKE